MALPEVHLGKYALAAMTKRLLETDEFSSHEKSILPTNCLQVDN